MSEPVVQPDRYASMKYRCIGPARGGRVVAVAGDPENRNVFYFGSTGGGVWKTTDGGKSWMNVSDGFFKYASVGALAVAPSDSNVIYAGMGETSIRSNVSRGDGVYKSTDGGKTWQHCGLEATQNIGEIVVDPRNPDVVYAAALGHVWGANPERGVYRSTDGGRTWDLVLHRSEKAGAVDLSMDPTNPRIIYASIWEASRGPHFLSSGGEDSGLWRTFDGGDTWEEISRKDGLPGEGVLGKIGVAASGARAGRVYAIVEHENGAVFRSDDYGESWTRGSEDRNLRQRAWYYHHIYADPQDANTLWVLNVNLWRSVDAGVTFQSVAVQHGDTHDLWIDPNDPQRMILGDDGGAEVTFEGGANWTPIENQLTAEFYHVTVDNRTPYRVFGAQQDNTTMSVPSRSNTGAITRHEYEEIGGGESGYIAVKPDDPDIIFAGSYGGLLTRYDRRTRLATPVNVWPEMTLGAASDAMRYRFQWTSPTVFSPHDPNVLYHGGNHVFRTTNLGQSWEPISDDLTRRDPETLVASGGPITKDNTGAETYATVFAIAESPLQQGLIWAGSDDGLIWRTRDAGENWENVTPGADLLPEWSLISIIEPSHHDAETCYVAATRYKSHDDRPYLLKTDDGGTSWQLITDGIPDTEFTRAIREDPEVAGLLFAGTEQGLYVSFNGGQNWQTLQLNLPVVPIHDMVIAQGDLVVATHGRSFWILDDITPLRHLARGEAQDGLALFAPRPTYRFASARGFNRPPSPGLNFFRSAGLVTSFKQIKKPDGEQETVWLDAGQNPPDGVVIHYYLPEKPEGDITLTIRDASGNEVRSYSSAKPDEAEYKDKPGLTKPTPIPAKQGANRFVWDFRYPNATEVPDDTGSMGFAGGAPTGPKAVPGEYQVDLTVNGQTLSQRFEVLGDPRTGATQEDYQAQFDLALKARDKLSELHEGVNRLRRIRKQIDTWIERLEDNEDVKSSGEELKAKLREVEDELIQWRAKAMQDTLNFPVKINAKLAALISMTVAAEGRPPQQFYDVYDYLSGIVDEQLGKLSQVIDEGVPAFNEKVRATGADAVVV